MTGSMFCERLSPLNVMLRYRELLVVEQLFRTTKDTRQINCSDFGLSAV